MICKLFLVVKILDGRRIQIWVNGYSDMFISV